MNAVVCQWPVAVGKRIEQIDESTSALRGKLRDRVHVQPQLRIVFRRIRQRRPQGFVPNRRKQDNVSAHVLHIVEDRRIALDKRFQPGFPRERFVHAVTDERDIRTIRAHVLFHRPEVQRAHLHVDGVASPPHVAKREALARVAQREQRLQIPVVDVPLDERVAQEQDVVPVLELKPRRVLRKRGKRSEDRQDK